MTYLMRILRLYILTGALGALILLAFVIVLHEWNVYGL